MWNKLGRIIKNELKTLSYVFRNRLYVSPKLEKKIAEQFHRLYYDSNNFGKSFFNTYWLGVPTLKCPFDLWIYQEIIHELKPDLVVETGTARGGSALFMASMLDLIGNGEILSIDIVKNDKRPEHRRIRYLLGSSTAPDIIDAVKKAAVEKKTVMVILDSDHSKKHVLNELRAYHAIVTKDSYLIVEDTNVNGHPVFPEHGPGPMEALQEFLMDNKHFVTDTKREKFYLTFNPKGFLKKAR